MNVQHRNTSMAVLALIIVALGGATALLASGDADASYGDVGEELSGTYRICFSDVGTIVEGPSILEAYTNDLGLTLSIGKKEYDAKSGDLSYRCSVIGTPTGSGEAVFTVMISYRALSNGEYTESTDQVRIDIYDPSEPVPVSKVILAAGEHTLPVGKGLTISARTVPERATDGSVVWSVDDGNGCVSIVSDGNTCYVTGISAGTAVVRCTAADGSGAEATYSVAVSESCYDYTLSFDANGGEGAPDDITEYAVDRYHRFDVVIPKDVPVRDGYGFEGWSWDADADEPTKSLSPGKTVKIGFPGKTLYAVWSERTDSALSVSVPGQHILSASPTLGSSADAVPDPLNNTGSAPMEDADEAQDGGSADMAALAAVAVVLIPLFGALMFAMSRRSR